jgi:hypothetical protein
LFGKQEDEDKFAEEMTNSFYNCILFPSQDSIPLNTYLENVKYPLKNEATASTSVEQPLLTVTVIDGTWGNVSIQTTNCNNII